MKPRVAAALLAFAALLLPGTPAAHASTTTPPPPPLPYLCDAVCQAGPPPAPTPIVKATPPTPTPPLVSVSLAPTRLRRGQAAKLLVTASASADARVIALVRYARSKPVTYRGKIGSAGTYSKAWKVPHTAPLGKASVEVAVDGTGDPTTLMFVVVK